MYLFDVSIQSAFLGQEFATVRANHTFHPRMIFPEMFDHVLSWDATHRASFLCSVFGLAPGPRHNFALFANISIDLQMQEYIQLVLHAPLNTLIDDRIRKKYSFIKRPFANAKIAYFFFAEM